MRYKCILVLSLHISAMTTALSQANSGELVSYYDFERNSDDKTGENDGLAINVSYPFMDKKNSQSFAEFFGNGSYITLKNSFDFENKTISFWFSAKVITEGAGIIYASDNPNLRYGLTAISVKQEENSTLNLYFNFSSAIYSIPIQENRWYHVAAVVEGHQYRYYLNGKLISSGTIEKYTKSGNGITSATVGCSRGFDRFFTGLMDELRIFSKALTEKEIKKLAKP